MLVRGDLRRIASARALCFSHMCSQYVSGVAHGSQHLLWPRPNTHRGMAAHSSTALRDHRPSTVLFGKSLRVAMRTACSLLTPRMSESCALTTHLLSG